MHVLHDPAAAPADEIAFEDFLRVDIRIGTVVEAEDFPRARKPALRLRIDFGPGLGVKRSSAQIKDRYEPGALIGRQVMAVVNFPPRQVGPVRSEVLVLGFADEAGRIVLAGPGTPVPNGARLA